MDRRKKHICVCSSVRHRFWDRCRRRHRHACGNSCHVPSLLFLFSEVFHVGIDPNSNESGQHDPNDHEHGDERSFAQPTDTEGRSRSTRRGSHTRRPTEHPGHLRRHQDSVHFHLIEERSFLYRLACVFLRATSRFRVRFWPRRRSQVRSPRLQTNELPNRTRKLPIKWVLLSGIDGWGSS